MRMVSFHCKKFSLIYACYIFLLITIFSLKVYGQPVFQSSTGTGGDASSGTVAIPAGTQPGDLLILAFVFEKGSDITINAAGLTGWNLILATNNSSNIGLRTYWRFAPDPVPTMPASYSFSWNTSGKYTISLTRITNAAISNPINNSMTAPYGSAGQTGSSRDMTAPGITTAINNSLVLAFFGHKKQNNNFASPLNTDGGTATVSMKSVTKRHRYLPGSNDGATNMLLTYVFTTAGATGTLAPTSTGDSDSWATQQIAISPFAAPDPCASVMVAAPTGSATQSFCASDNPTVGDLEPAMHNGNRVRWYAMSMGGDTLANTVALTTATTYYGAAVDANGCESTGRLAVTVTINQNPGTPTGSATQSFCASENPTVGDLSANAGGNEVVWYDSETGGDPLEDTESLEDGETYYAAAVNEDGCESTGRLAVIVNILSSPCYSNIEDGGLSVFDPPSCDNPNNIYRGIQLFLLYDELEVTGITDPNAEIYVTSASNFRDINGDPIITPIKIGEADGTGNVDIVFPFYRLPGEEVTIQINGGEITETFDAFNEECPLLPIPAMSTWAILILGMCILIIAQVTFKNPGWIKN